MTRFINCECAWVAAKLLAFVSPPQRSTPARAFTLQKYLGQIFFLSSLIHSTDSVLWNRNLNSHCGRSGWAAWHGFGLLLLLLLLGYQFSSFTRRDGFAIRFAISATTNGGRGDFAQ